MQQAGTKEEQDLERLGGKGYPRGILIILPNALSTK